MKFNRLCEKQNMVIAMYNQNKELYYKQLQRDVEVSFTKREKVQSENDLYKLEKVKGIKVDHATLEDVNNELKGEGYFVDRIRREKELEIYDRSR